ncbi:MAG: hypothetical protein JWM68_3927 [Verrucomicrobiales bacterium]|nr:hypothetical protein [Verrucomicrobiales bacterium]
MKSAFASMTCMAFALVLASIGCSDKAEKPATPPTQQEKTRAMLNSIEKNTNDSVVSAPAGYLGAMVKSKQSAVKTIDVTALNSALEQFNVGEGRYPKDLDELVTKGYITKIPAAPIGMKIVYDATAGTVKAVNE